MNLPKLGTFAPARLLRARRAAAEQSFLEIEPPSGFVEAHERPGQFCRIRVGGDEGIFAMFSSPGSAPRFLVRVGSPDGGEAADALSELPDGSAIEMSLPAGEGFGLERARGRDVRFVATGTGVAPVCAAIERVLHERDAYGVLSLDHGLKTEAHLAIERDIARWRAAGVEVRIAYSRIDDAGALVGTTVQESLRTHVASLSGSVVVGVGQHAMLESLHDLVAELGGEPDALLTNI